jgi:glutamine synthetase
VALNTAVAESLRQFADELEGAEDFETSLHNLIRRTIHEHKRIIFNGNGYDDTMIDMIRHQILPAVSDYSAALCGRAVQKAALGVSNVYETRTATGVGRLCDNLLDACEKLESAVAATPEDAERAMQYSRDAIVPAMQRAREIADQLESITASACWPFPAYRDLLFYL